MIFFQIVFGSRIHSQWRLICLCDFEDGKRDYRPQLGLESPVRCQFSTSLSAYDCKVGRKLQKIEGSVCHSCYATRGNYAYDVVKNAHKARKAALSDPQWVDAMTLLIGHFDKSDPYFRIHDSGDIQDYDHLMKCGSRLPVTCRGLTSGRLPKSTRL